MSNSLQLDNRSVSLFPRTAEHSIVPGLGGCVQVYKPRSVRDRLISFFETANGGPFRFMQMGDRFCTLFRLLGLGNGFGDAAKVFNKAWTATILPHLPFALKDAKEAIESLGTPAKTAEAQQRKYVSTVQDVATAVAACGYSAALFVPQAALAPILSVAGHASTVSDVCELKQITEELSQARALNRQVSVLNNVSEEVKQHFADTEKVLMLKTAKAVCAVGGFVLGVALVATGLATSHIWMVAAATVSLAGSVFAFASGVYEEGMRYERTKFFSEKHIQPLALA